MYNTIKRTSFFRFRAYTATLQYLYLVFRHKDELVSSVVYFGRNIFDLRFCN